MAFDDQAEIDRLADIAARQAAGPATAPVKFTMEPYENPEKSKEAGRAIYDEVEFIEIKVPGSIDFVKRPVRPEDKEKFAAAYVEWRKRGGEVISGTPLKMWPAIRIGQVREAEYMNLRTVEELAELADVHLQKLGPGWIDLRQKARDFLKSAKDSSVLVKMRDELKDRDERLETLTRMFEEQKRSLDSLKKQLGK